MLLDNFGISNFKCFNSPVKIGQRRITLNIGPNNSGKSAFMTAIKFFNHTLINKAFKPSRDEIIVSKLDSLLLKSLGKPAEFLNQEDLALEYIISIQEENKPENLQGLDIAISLNFLFIPEYSINLMRNQSNKLRFSPQKMADGIGTLFKFTIYINENPAITIERKDPRFKNTISKRVDGEIVTLTIINSIFTSGTDESTNTFEIELNASETTYFYNNAFLIKKIKTQLIENYYKYTNQLIDIIDCCFESILNFQNEIEKFKTIELNRREYRRYIEIGNSAAFDYFINKYYDERNLTNINKTNDLLKKVLPLFGITHEIEITEPNEFGFQINVIMPGGKGTKRNLIDFGSGINQMLPLLLTCSAMTNVDSLQNNIDGQNGELFYKMIFNDSLMYIEEPESNLHPNFQSKLADMFNILSKERKIDFIVETHSEYMIRRFQYLVAKRELKPHDIIINYFWVDNGEHKCKQIEFTEAGGLTKTFEPGFYDESLSQQLELMKINSLN